MTRRVRGLANLTERNNVDILCLQKTKWKGSKARNIGGGCKLFYNGADGRRNGIKIVVREELAESVLEVKRVSGKLMALKIEVKGSILNIVSAYAPKVNNGMKEVRNKEGSMVLDFAKMMDLAIVNTYFKKKHEHRVTYKSGEKSTQIDYVMCRRRNLKEMCDCKVIVNECVAKQHRMVICKMALMVKKKKAKK